MGLLEALREGLGATGVGLFDDDRADPGRQPPNFWDAFETRDCGEIDWVAWYQTLRAQERVETSCGCGGRHQLLGFLIHDRWALLVIAPATMHAGVAVAIASSVKALAAQLPPAKKPDPQRPDERAETDDDELPGGPLWMARKAPH